MVIEINAILLGNTMGEQFNLQFESDPFESLSDEELARQYKDTIGVSPRIGRNGRNDLITALKNPQTEREVLAAIDAKDDKEELRNPYVPKSQKPRNIHP